MFIFEHLYYYYYYYYITASGRLSDCRFGVSPVNYPDPDYFVHSNFDNALNFAVIIHVPSLLKHTVTTFSVSFQYFGIEGGAL